MPDTYVSSIHVNDSGAAVAAALAALAVVYKVVDDAPLTKRPTPQPALKRPGCRTTLLPRVVGPF